MHPGTPSAPAGWYRDPRDPYSMIYWDGARWSPHRRPAAGVGAQPLTVPPAAPRADRSPHQVIPGLDNTILTGIGAVVVIAVVMFAAFWIWSQPAGFDESRAAGVASGQDGPARTAFEAGSDAAASCEMAWDAAKKFSEFHAFSRMSFTEGCAAALAAPRPKSADRPI
ncbi:DUF2510 domain-containing protein [Mycolicibacterium sediminis]|uniref:DUF2510 domain-containing protein n=1 Tax=Mycolicibacterium sediminis TaxID=1286180 RepID=A0A7I7QMN4_9MYCO|nr:DUF2510 domain-containing protein [Mycolicibacterium sediminis]BBY27613.1 hypothetical protein MSEDJ_17090 [Mycolicibacterium sediminis]